MRPPHEQHATLKFLKCENKKRNEKKNDKREKRLKLYEILSEINNTSLVY